MAGAAAALAGAAASGAGVAEGGLEGALDVAPSDVAPPVDALASGFSDGVGVGLGEATGVLRVDVSVQVRDVALVGSPANFM